MKFVLHVCAVLVLDNIIFGVCCAVNIKCNPNPDPPKASGSDSSDSDSSSSSSDSESNEKCELKKLTKMVSDGDSEEIDRDTMKQFILELKAGSTADLFGTNQHIHQPDAYIDLSRRFVPEYPYTEVRSKPVEKGELKPTMAPPEVVLAIAKESAILEASKPLKPTDEDAQKEILRTGEFWNDVWKEDINPESLLRTEDKKRKNLETINVTIMPGSSLYDMVSKLKEKSSRLLYIINNKQKKK